MPRLSLPCAAGAVPLLRALRSLRARPVSVPWGSQAAAWLQPSHPVGSRSSSTSVQHCSRRGSSASPTAPAPCLQLPPALAWHAGSPAVPRPPLLLPFSSFSRRTRWSNTSAAAAFGSGEVLSTTRLLFLVGAALLAGTAQGHGAARASRCSSGSAGRKQRGGAPAVPGRPRTEPQLPPALWQVEESPGSWGRGSQRFPSIVSQRGSCLSWPDAPRSYSRDWGSWQAGSDMFMGGVASLDPKWFCPQPSPGLPRWGGRWAPAGGAAPAPWGETGPGAPSHSWFFS